MRIAAIISSLRMGGAERVMTSLCGGLADRAHDVTLVTMESPSKDFYPLSPAVRRVTLEGRQSPSLLNLFREVRRQRAEVVLSFLPRSNVGCCVVGSLLRVPVVISERIDPRSERLPRATRVARQLAYPHAAAIVLQTTGAVDWAREIGRGVPVEVVPNHVKPLPATALANVREPLVVGMGRLIPHKRFDWLIRAFAANASDHQNHRLVIAGDGPERESLRQLSVQLGVGSRVELPGPIRDVGSLLQRAQIFVLSSEMEGFPNALAEAMAAGVAVLSTDCPTGPADLVTPSRDGVLVPLDDFETYSRELGNLLGDPDRCRRLGTAARGVLDRFAPDRILDEWEGILVGAVGRAT